MFRFAHVTPLAICAALGSSIACSGAPGDLPAPGEGTQHTSNAIINGTPASAYEEASLVSMYQNGQLNAYCSGSVIAPKVVLTAGHCVDGFTSWKIKSPYANGTVQNANASAGATYDWMENGSETVNPNHHDIGLIFLDTAITLGTYPQLAQSPLPNNSMVVNIGRIQSGTLSQTALFVSTPIAVTAGSSQGFPFDYAAQEVIESGDSGGPDEVPGSSPHLIVSVNSGAGGGEVLARVDLLYSWIQMQIAAHGGGGGGGGGTPDAGGGGNPTPDAGGGGGGGGVDSGFGSVDGGGGGGGGGGGADSGHGGGGGGGGNGDSGIVDPGSTDDDSGTGGNGDNGSGTWPTSQASGCSMNGGNGGTSGGLAIALGAVAIGLASRRRRSR